MLNILQERLRQKHRTIGYPAEPPTLPDRLRGLPVIDPERCPDGCRDCIAACPTAAIRTGDRGFGIDLGRCLFCTECSRTCSNGAVQMTTEYRLAVRRREDLFRTRDAYRLAEAL